MNPVATSHSISYFKSLYQEGSLDLSPTFQRKPVWSPSQSSYLIDSILSNLPVPEVYLRTIVDSSGDSRREVIDGQQRLRSIIEFFSGELELVGSDVSEQWLRISWDDLSEAQKKDFWEYKIVTRELENASDLEVRDMFRRLNSNQSSLNPQELRHSQYHGEFISIVEDLSDNNFWLDNRIASPMQVRRMLDTEFVSELLVAVMSGPLDKKSGLESYYSEYDEDFPDGEYWKDQFEEIRDFTKIIVGGDLKLWRSKTDYYSLFGAVGRVLYDDELPNKGKLAKAIKRVTDFGEKIKEAKRKDGTKTKEVNVLKYVEAATRASTDLSRREERIGILHDLILGK